ncbi:MAG TPA: SIS domain-containing protein [Novosphingobium sp.]
MAIFPNRPFDHAADYADAYFARLAEAAASVDRAALDRAAALITAAAQEGRRIYSCGNGGSAAIANHLVCDCLKGIRNESTLRPEVVSLSTTIELITAIGNDLGYDQIFSYQLESLGRPGDVLMAISSSGNSPNILAAIQAARAIGMTVIAMTGFDGGAAARMADVSLHVRAENYGLVEDVHQALMHLLAQFIRQQHLADPSTIGRIKF